MPKTPRVPEHWKEDYDESDEEIVMDMEPESPQIYEEKELDLLKDEGTDRMDMMLETNNTKGNELDQELERLKQKKLDKEMEKQKKQDIKDKKTEIRHLKYEPVYDAGEKLKAYGSKLGKFIQEKRGSSDQRKYRRDKMKTRMKKVANVAKKKFVKFGKSMKDDKRSKGSMFSAGQQGNNRFFNETNSGHTPKILDNTGNKFMNSDISSALIGRKNSGFFNQSGGKNFNRNTPRIMQGNLLGNNKSKAGKGKKKQKAKPGLKLMNERIRL